MQLVGCLHGGILRRRRLASRYALYGDSWAKAAFEERTLAREEGGGRGRLLEHLNRMGV